jgi:hypothetical protein
LQSAHENGLNFKVAILPTGYGQALLDNSVVSILGPNDLFQSAWAPVELNTPATKQFQADLKKYNGFTGVPDYGQYTGYVIGDLLVEGLKASGKNLTRQGLIDSTKALPNWRSAGLGCQATDLSKASFGKAPASTCGWYVYVKNHKFQVYNNGKPISGTLITGSTSAAPSTS